MLQLGNNTKRVWKLKIFKELNFCVLCYVKMESNSTLSFGKQNLAYIKKKDFYAGKKIN